VERITIFRYSSVGSKPISPHLPFRAYFIAIYATLSYQSVIYEAIYPKELAGIPGECLCLGPCSSEIFSGPMALAVSSLHTGGGAPAEIKA